MTYIKNMPLYISIAILLLSCFASRPCRNNFTTKALKNETTLREVCEYILSNKISGGFDHESAFGLDSVKNERLRANLKMIDIGTIYIHNKKTYEYAYPQDSSIAFSRTYIPLKTNRHELIVFSFSKSSDTLKSQDFKNVKEGTIFCRLKPDIFYYSY
jgi:hypothetical protein